MRSSSFDALGDIAELALGRALDLGDVVLIAQRQAARARRPARIPSALARRMKRSRFSSVVP
jgi:hypothetical protein